MKAHYKTSIAISLIVIIVLVILRTTVTGQDSIKFIDNTDDQPIDQQNSDSIDLRYSNEYQSWKQTSDTTFRSLFNGNQQADILAEHPGMMVLWAGYAFSKDYLSPRGHMYSIEDLYKSLRTGAPMTPTSGPQPAACWACKSPDIPRLLTTTNAKTLYKKKWAELGNEIVNPIGCADCHEPQSMGLRVTRSFLKSAYKRNGLRIEDATEQEMRSLVCAQCHAEYYFQGEDRILALPWDQGYTVENIEAYYDSINFTDFTHKLSRAHLIKAQHPDFELFQMGIHGQRGVSCRECHMPAIGEDENRYNNHHIKSPLAMIDRTCQACHRESEETLRKDVYERQNKVYAIRMRVEEELTKAHIEAKFAWDKGATESQMKNVLKLLRQPQWRWDFAVASHGAAFHAPQEVTRILGSGLDKSTQARIQIMKVLAQLGYTQDVPMPDISTKAKAQQYIGLDMEAEQQAKQKFLETVIPQWQEEARANKRFIEGN